MVGCMKKIAIPYYSGSGHTAKLATHIAEGMQFVDSVQVKLFNVEELTPIDDEYLANADAIIFGAPTYMGSIAGHYKLFMERYASDFWVEQRWANKIAAGFTVATYPSGDKLTTLMQLAIFALQHGMIWVGLNEIGSRVKKDTLNINESGSWLGLMATSADNKKILINEHDAQTARLFGKRILDATLRWNHSNIF
jgi:NAD(P)H dehydrogenase (quinone)